MSNLSGIIHSKIHILSSFIRTWNTNWDVFKKMYHSFPCNNNDWMIVEWSFKLELQTWASKMQKALWKYHKRGPHNKVFWSHIIILDEKQNEISLFSDKLLTRELLHQKNLLSHFLDDGQFNLWIIRINLWLDQLKHLKYSSKELFVH